MYTPGSSAPNGWPRKRQFDVQQPEWGTHRVPPALPHVYSVGKPGEKYNVLSYLEPDHVFQKGIPNEGIIGILPASVTDFQDPSFRANPAFVKFLHHVIAKHGPQTPGIVAAVRGVAGGWMQIVDARAPQPRSEAEPEDILGEFEVKEGSVLEGSYQPNPAYRVVGKRGLLILDPWLHQKLMEELVSLPSPGTRT
jgi:hypothetical protein